MNRISWHQIPLVNFLIKKAGIELEFSTLQVEPLDDGGMGSMKFSTAINSSRFGENVAEATFKDIDGVEVSAALYLDQDGRLFELDIFKSDFSKLEQWPNENDCI